MCVCHDLYVIICCVLEIDQFALDWLSHSSVGLNHQVRMRSSKQWFQVILAYGQNELSQELGPFFPSQDDDHVVHSLAGFWPLAPRKSTEYPYRATEEQKGGWTPIYWGLFFRSIWKYEVHFSVPLFRLIRSVTVNWRRAGRGCGGQQFHFWNHVDILMIIWLYIYWCNWWWLMIIYDYWFIEYVI